MGRKGILLGLAALIVVVGAITGTAGAQAQTGDGQPVAAYSLAAPEGATKSGIVARAVVPRGAPCPKLVVTKANGSERSVSMTIRHAPDTTGAAFASLTSCSADVPANSTTATVGGISIPAAMPSRIDRMAIFGDTGCRLKGTTIQDCATVDDWPLARISASMAKEKPDLVVFTGDFFYREAACPPTSAALCGGSPSPIPGMSFNDTSYSWAADVFTPMSPIFSIAPIVVTRGNHEACYRGGNGYFIYFDPRKGTESNCAPAVAADGDMTVPSTDLNPSYAVDVHVDSKRDLRLVVVDSAYGQDCEPSIIAPLQRTRYDAAQKLAKNHNSWLIVHRPVVGWQANSDCAPNGAWISADQAVASAGLLGDYQMMLSSHIHAAEAVNIPGLPGQLVIGNGGTLLDEVLAPIPNTGPSFGPVSYPAPSSSWFASRFGYVLATPGSGKDWTMHMRDPNGRTFATCSLAKKNIDCMNRS